MKPDTIKYRNYFSEIGISDADADKRVRECFDTVFNGPDGERIYFDVGDDMGFITDTGNDDVRTEGMSYAMMMCVQMNEKEKFDRLWKWTKTYMWMAEGWNRGYFIWSCNLDGTPRGNGPAPDGEEYFAMDLFLASHRWGDGDGIFNYSQEAKDILEACLHNGDENRPGEPMWNRENHLIKFITNVEYTDPSYHLPHFYECFAMWANEEDRDFWAQAAKCSREYLVKACHPVTGLSAEYAEYDGSPKILHTNAFGGRHDWFFSDAYRTAANIGMDACWCGATKELTQIARNIEKFFVETCGGEMSGIFLTDGTDLHEKAKHYVGLPATNAESAIAVLASEDVPEADRKNALYCIEKLWNMPMQTGKFRYYDNCLYLFAMMALSGNYRIY